MKPRMSERARHPAEVPPPNSSYDDWALYYDVIHEGIPGDVGYYVERAVRHGGRVLELGIGTGRIGISMALAGVHVTGVDNSRSMLALCREKASLVAPLPGSLYLVQADMAALALNTLYPCIFLPYRTFMHLLDPERQRQCLRACHRYLASDGLLVMDVWAARPAVLARIARASAGKPRLVGRYRVDDARITVVHRHCSALDEARQWIIERHLIEERDQMGKVMHQSELAMTRAYFTPAQLLALAGESGFEVVECHGTFDGTAFTARSDDMILSLRKRHQGETSR